MVFFESKLAMTFLTRKIVFLLALISLITTFSTPAAYFPLPVAIDMNQDGADDLVLYNEDALTWRILSLDGSPLVDNLEFGRWGSIPLVGKMGEDNVPTIGFYQPDAGKWYVLPSLSHDPETDSVVRNVDAQARPLIGSFFEADHDVLALFDPSNNAWTFWGHDGVLPVAAIQFGYDRMTFVAADTTGDGICELIGYDNVNNTWQTLSLVSAFEPRVFNAGSTLGIPVVRDFNGDGKADLGLWDNYGSLNVIDALSGEAIHTDFFGDNYSVPVHAAYEGNKKVNLSYYAVGRGVWHVRLHNGVALSPNQPKEYEWISHDDKNMESEEYE